MNVVFIINIIFIFLIFVKFKIKKVILEYKIYILIFFF